MNTKMLSLIGMGTILFSGCGGSALENATTSASTTSENYTGVLAVASLASLPTCDATTLGRVYYVEEKSEFQICKAAGWTAIDLKGAKGDAGATGAAGSAGATGAAGTAGISITARYRFHTDTYVGQTDIASDTATLAAYIGTVQLIIFSDGSAFVSVSGYTADRDSATNTYAFDFNPSFFLPASTSEQEYIVKSNSYANTRTRFLVNLAASPTPTFKAIMDTDGNFGNQSDVSYSLTKL